jgi:stage III sporulation protein AD
MSAIYASLICVGAALVCAHLKKRWPELALGIAIAAGLAVLAAFVPDIASMVSAMRTLAQSSGMDTGYTGVMLRACGISLVAEFAAQICRDAGESALSGRILLCARLALLAMAAPIVTDILSRLSRLLSL